MFRVYATGWYTVTETELNGSFGQYASMVIAGHSVQWDATDKRYVVRN